MTLKLTPRLPKIKLIEKTDVLSDNGILKLHRVLTDCAWVRYQQVMGSGIFSLLHIGILAPSRSYQQKGDAVLVCENSNA